MHHPADMKSAAITVRVSEPIKRKLASRARREHRSLSAQIEHELVRALADEREPTSPRARGFVGMFEGARLPSEADISEVRGMLWGRLAKRGRHA
jgi:hypothetical protein